MSAYALRVVTQTESALGVGGHGLALAWVVVYEIYFYLYIGNLGSWQLTAHLYILTLVINALVGRDGCSEGWRQRQAHLGGGVVHIDEFVNGFVLIHYAVHLERAGHLWHRHGLAHACTRTSGYGWWGVDGCQQGALAISFYIYVHWSLALQRLVAGILNGHADICLA